MAITSSGAIELSNNIGGELGGSAGAETGLEDAATGGIATINTASSSYPNATAPHLMSEWYSYDHSASAGWAGTTTDLIARFDLQDSNDSTSGSSTTWADMSDNSATTMTRNGTPVYTAASGGNPAYWTFDGTDESFDWTNAQIPAELKADDERTTCFWAYPTTTTDSIITQGTRSRGNAAAREWDMHGTGTWMLHVQSNGSSYLTGSSTHCKFYLSSFEVSYANNWHFFAITYSGDSSSNGVKFYENNVLKKQTYTNGNNQRMTQPYYVGGVKQYGSYAFTGRIGAVQLYDRELTSTELTANWNADKAKYGY